MRNFLTKSGPGLLAIAMVAGLGYFVLTPPEAPAGQSAASELAFHDADCLVCRLPLHGRGTEASRLGHDSHAPEAAMQSTQ
jgi:hypothetical protein